MLDRDEGRDALGQPSVLAFVLYGPMSVVRAHKVANEGHDMRALQHYLGQKNMQHTGRYTELAPDRFKNFWKD